MTLIINELRRFMTDIGITDATWHERVAKLDEEYKERQEVILSPDATLDELISEHADLAIVAGTIFVRAMDDLRAMGISPVGAMLEKMDAVRRR